MSAAAQAGASAAGVSPQQRRVRALREEKTPALEGWSGSGSSARPLRCSDSKGNSSNWLYFPKCRAEMLHERIYKMPAQGLKLFLIFSITNGTVSLFALEHWTRATVTNSFLMYFWEAVFFQTSMKCLCVTYVISIFHYFPHTAVFTY